MRTINAEFERGVEAAGSFASTKDFDVGQTFEAECEPMDLAIDDSEIAELIHDIRNTIGAVAMLSELTSLELAENSDLREMSHNVQRACRDASAQCKQILVAFRGLPRRTEPTDLSGLVRDMAPLLATWIPPVSVLRFHLANDLPELDLAPNDIRQVVTNLVKNAAEAIGNRPGIVTVSTGWFQPGADRSDRDHAGMPAIAAARQVCLTVSDTGRGMDEASCTRLQTEHFSSKPNGHGLGLASVRRIVAAHAAQLHVTSRLGAGTTVRVVFGNAAAVRSHVPLRHGSIAEWPIEEEYGPLPEPGNAGRSIPEMTTRTDRMMEASY